MNINTIFRAFVGRDINLSGINYENAYQNEDIKAVTALMFILQNHDFPVPQNYSYRYATVRGVYSFDLVEDVLEQNNEAENIELPEEIMDFAEHVNLSIDPKRKVTSGLTSAVQYYYYDKVCRIFKKSEEDYKTFFPQEHPRDSYKLGKKVWKNLKAYIDARQAQPE